MRLLPRLDETRTDFRTLGAFAIASAAAVAVGSIGLALVGADPGSWMRNPAAWLVGLGIAALLVSAGRSPSILKGAVLLAIAALVATLFSPAQAGVHRWVDAGPLHINMAALLLPAALVALATLNLAGISLLGAIVSIGVLLVLQPDASQATAFLLAATPILLKRRLPMATKASGTIVIVALLTAAWLRPDRLQPVPAVEGMFALLAGVSPALAAFAGVALALTSAIPLRRAYADDSTASDAARTLVIYFVAAGLMPLFGAFPVPIVGLGMSFPVGYWMGMALLCARAARARAR